MFSYSFHPTSLHLISSESQGLPKHLRMIQHWVNLKQKRKTQRRLIVKTVIFLVYLNIEVYLNIGITERIFQKLSVWCILLIPELVKLSPEDCKFGVSLDYIVKPCLKNNKKKTSQLYWIAIMVEIEWIDI